MKLFATACCACLVGLIFKTIDLCDSSARTLSPIETSSVSSVGVGPLQDQDEEDLLDEIRKQARQSFMQGKLASNQLIVEGLTTKNFQKIADGAESVVGMVKGQHWFVVDNPEYRNYSSDMEKIAGKLNQAAADKNVEAAALRYFELTLNCIDCHQYIDGLNLGR